MDGANTVTHDAVAIQMDGAAPALPEKPTTGKSQTTCFQGAGAAFENRKGGFFSLVFLLFL